MRCLASLLLLLPFAGCHATPPALPSQGGPAWRELVTAHFTMWTDAPQGQATEVLQRMEQRRQVVLGVGFTGTQSDAKVFVIAFRDREEATQFLPENAAAMAERPGALKQSSIVISVDMADDEIVTHELVHAVTYDVIRHAPLWFHEGFAGFLQTMKVVDGHGEVGMASNRLLAPLRRHRTPSAKLLACTTYCDDTLHASAWALFSYLANTRPRDLIAYARRLDEDAATAWSASFPDVPVDELDARIREWLAVGPHRRWTYDVRVAPVRITSQRTLADADALAVRAVLQARDAASPALARALAADPTHLIANLLSADFAKAIDLAHAKRIAAAHPGDWRAWWLVGLGARWDGEEAMRARERGCALPDAASTWCERPR